MLTCADCSYSGPFRVCGDGKTEGRLYARLAPSNDSPIVCDVCAAKRDLADMEATGRATLYLSGTGRGAKITNWSGTLSFPVYGAIWQGRHNIAGVQEFANFCVAGDPFVWTGRCIGRNTQIFHARRTKARAAITKAEGSANV